MDKGLLWKTFVKHYDMELRSQMPLTSSLYKNKPN